MYIFPRLDSAPPSAAFLRNPEEFVTFATLFLKVQLVIVTLPVLSIAPPFALFIAQMELFSNRQFLKVIVPSIFVNTPPKTSSLSLLKWFTKEMLLKEYVPLFTVANVFVLSPSMMACPTPMNESLVV